MDLRARDADILRRHEAGELHTTIASDYGLTRARVGQIVDRVKGGGDRRRQTSAKRDVIAAYIDQNWVTAAQAAAHFRVSEATIYNVARIRGVDLPTREFADELRLMNAAARVRAGASINSVALSAKMRPATLQYYCEQKGIKSNAPTRWSDHSHRTDLTRQWRMEGKTWSEINDLMAAHEGVAFRSPQTIYQWVTAHAPDILAIRGKRPRKERKPRPKALRKARPVKEPASIELRPTVRETAMANRGRATAAEIASVLGVTRNSIIGHWFRGRQVHA